MKTFDIGIIGGGIVGTAIAFGELLRGKNVIIFDGDKDDNKASFANFGLVWVQGKGKGLPAYQKLTKKSSDLWPGFVEQLEDISGIQLQYERNGGLVLCVSEDDFERRQKHLEALSKDTNETPDWEMLGRNETQMRFGSLTLGCDVIGSSYCKRDGAVNPLRLAKALTIAIKKLGGVVMRQAPVQRITKNSQHWQLTTLKDTYSVGAVIVSAGLGSKTLANDFGVDLPISADKGQIIVCERMPQTLSLPASGIRQTKDGTFMFGVTHEGDQDRRSTLAGSQKLAHRAIKILPQLEHLKVVRQWAGHRIVTPDTYPIYMQPEENLTFAVCHSGITLAAFHSTDWIRSPRIFSDFNVRRFLKEE
ncbi:MAG: FAD-dependent oxidoreductase [Lentilitoribacter sp.]